MKIVQDYLKSFLEMGEAAFLNQHNHPFLLYPEQHGAGGFSSYHTRMADRGAGSSISETSKEIMSFKVLTPTLRQGQSSPNKLFVGRVADRDFNIDHSTVSKRHAFIVFDLDKHAYKMGDAGSTNGTFLNGQPVEAGDPVYIRDGNIVSFGDCDYMFFTPGGFLNLLKRLKSE